ncbi:MAG: cyclic nucleotide-binding domain-containing protein [Ignavibacteriales bacterium]|nr:cyclic nucleotide-binding domain-containing protein [Ignavibacteriales bacterium]MCB9258896.1 cyclic nucleotide-binding domain-containing protein [Ignavibacteriales bacterium]
MNQQVLNSLKDNNLLKNADLNKLNIGKEIGKIKTLHGGEVIYREGDSANSVYLVINGEINLVKKNSEGKSHSFIYSDNDFFGAKELFANINRCTLTVSLKTSNVIELTKKEIEYMMQNDDSVLFNIQKSNYDFKFDKELSKKITDKLFDNLN